MTSENPESKWQCEEYFIYIYIPYVLLFHECNISHVVPFHFQYICSSSESATVTPK